MTEVNRDELEVFEENKKKMLDQLMAFPLRLWDQTGGDKNQGQVNEGVVGDVITENDVWFATTKPRPIIKEEGFNKLVKATGARFPKVVFIEKQSDYNVDFRKGQVVVEATVQFPQGSEIERQHSELGVANEMNCSQKLSKENMPIMAQKRAKSRAFFRSQYINMVVYDETEVADDLSNTYTEAVKKRIEAENEVKKKDEQIKKLEKQNQTMTKRSTEFFELVKNNTKVKGKTVWEMDDLGKMKSYVEKNKENLNPLEERLFTLRINELEKLEAQKQKEEEKKNVENKDAETEAEQKNKK